MIFVTNSYSFIPVLDADAQVYINAVESADGQSLENEVKVAINNFVIGCKSDGIWSALKSSCILAGARTLSGALVPLVGSAPTNFNFVSADYDRKTGLKGNGSTKYLNSNVAGDSSFLPQSNAHISVYASVGPTASARGAYIANSATTTGSTFGGVGIARGAVGAGTNVGFLANIQNASATTQQAFSINAADWLGFKGARRNSSANVQTRNKSQNYSYTNSSTTRIADQVMVFRLGVTSIYGDGRYSFYSIGESLDLAALDTRVSTLMTDLAAAIP